jgi:hypothetical protein
MIKLKKKFTLYKRIKKIAIRRIKIKIRIKNKFICDWRVKLKRKTNLAKA